MIFIHSGICFRFHQRYRAKTVDIADAKIMVLLIHSTPVVAANVLVEPPRMSRSIIWSQ